MYRTYLNCLSFLVSGLGTRSFTHRSFTNSLRSLRSNVRLWAIRSDCSGQMSNCERIARGAHQKWAMWANCLGRSPKKREWANRSFFLSKSLIYSLFANFCKKTSNLLSKQMSEFPSLLSLSVCSFFRYRLIVLVIMICWGAHQGAPFKIYPELWNCLNSWYRRIHSTPEPMVQPNHGIASFLNLVPFSLLTVYLTSWYQTYVIQ